MIYGITAAELHDSIIADLRQFAAHRDLDISRIGTGDERPLEQTIRLVMELYASEEVGLPLENVTDQELERWVSY